jgi:hypothetical protein
VRVLRRGAIALGLGLCAALGCDQQPDPEPEEAFDEADIVVAERSNSSLKATVNLAHVADIYRANDIGDLVVDEQTVRSLAVLALQISLEHVYDLFGCEPMIDTDGSTYVQATFVGCRTLFLELEGTARAGIEVLTDAGSPQAIEWRVDGTDFSIHNPQQEFTPLFRGIVRLTTSLRGGTMKWETGGEEDGPFEIDLAIGRFDARSVASWTIDDNECVTMDLEAQLTQLDMDDDLDEEIGDIVVSVDKLVQCQDRCPQEGTVNLAYGAGEILQWSYSDESVVQIAGPGGRHFEAALPCD